MFILKKKKKKKIFVFKCYSFSVPNSLKKKKNFKNKLNLFTTYLSVIFTANNIKKCLSHKTFTNGDNCAFSPFLNRRTQSLTKAVLVIS